MDWLHFSTYSVPILAALILAAAGAAYLLALPRKSVATWWLIATLGGYILLQGAILVWSSVDPAVAWFGVAPSLSMAGRVIFAGAFAQFAYRFLTNPFPREARLVLGGTALLLVATIVAEYRTAGLVNVEFPYQGAFLLHIWTAVVFARKGAAALSEKGIRPGIVRLVRPPEGEARAHAAFLGLALFVVLLGLLEIAIQAGLVPFVIHTYLVTLGAVILLVGLVVVYLNHAPEPSTFQAKLTGLALGTVLFFLAVAVHIAHPFQLLVFDFAEREPDQLHTIVFHPIHEGGYSVQRGVEPFREELGHRLPLDGVGNVAVALPFAFPFDGREWREAIVTSGGAIAFERPPAELHTPRLRTTSTNFYRTLFDGVPKIAPAFVDYDLREGGGVFLRSDDDRVVVTWSGVRIYDALQGVRPASAQAVLSADGSIAFAYSGAPLFAVRGLYFGGRTADARPLAASNHEPLVLRAGETILDNGLNRARHYIHDRISGLVWLMIASPFFIVVVFPLFFRLSILRPLDRLMTGVRRVEDGDLEVAVPIQTRDEIGYLTHHFNRMTGSVREYHHQMEDLVAQRTAELERSLAELKAAQAQLVQQEKLASLGALTAGIAHEIKNPLNFINNFAQLNSELAREARESAATGATGEELDELLADIAGNSTRIAEHGRRADGIVKSMLDHSRQGSGERQQVDLNALVDEYVALAYHGMRARRSDFECTIEKELGPALPPVEVVPQDIGRVLLNIVTNAFDAVHERRLHCSGAGYSPRLEVTTAAADGGVQIRVRDNGPGIPADRKERIFEPFYTTKAAGEGTGLGLSLSHDIVVQGHGGRIEVESAADDGTTFVVTLPCVGSSRDEQPQMPKATGGT